MDKAKLIADLVKGGAFGSETYFSLRGLIPSVIFIIVFIVLINMGLPWFMGIPFIIFIVLINAVGFIRVKRIGSAKLSPQGQNPGIETNIINIDADERVVNYLCGIMRTGAYVGTEVLGKGENKGYGSLR